MKSKYLNSTLSKTALGITLLSSAYFLNTHLKSNKINLFPFLNNQTNLEAKANTNNIEVIDNEYYKSDISKFMKDFYSSPLLRKDSFLFLCGENSSQITNEIAKELNSPIGKINIKRKNKSSESSIKILENVSNRNVVLINSMSPPVNDNLMEILFTVSALKRSSAKKIIVIIPYFGYSTKVEKDSFSNFPLYSSLIIKLIEKMGADQIITINLSSKHITGYSYSIPIIDLDMTFLGVSYYVEKLGRNEILNNPVIISPHVSSCPRARKFQDMLNANGFDAGFGFLGTSNKSTEEKIDFHTERADSYIGDDFTGRDLIIVDDMIKTGETLCMLSDWLKKNGGEKVSSFIYHDLSQPITKNNVINSSINEVVLLNTANSDNTWCDKIIKLSTSKVLSKYISELL